MKKKQKWKVTLTETTTVELRDLVEGKHRREAGENAELAYWDGARTDFVDGERVEVSTLRLATEEELEDYEE